MDVAKRLDLFNFLISTWVSMVSQVIFLGTDKFNNEKIKIYKNSYPEGTYILIQPTDATVIRFKEKNKMKEEDKDCRAWEQGRNIV